jgi:hypothetical protein
MGVIFPLSVPGRIILVIIAIFLGMICWMVWKPEFWRKLIGKKKTDVQEPPKMAPKK